MRGGHHPGYGQPQGRRRGQWLRPQQRPDGRCHRPLCRPQQGDRGPPVRSQRLPAAYGR